MLEVVDKEPEALNGSYRDSGMAVLLDSSAKLVDLVRL